MKSIHSIVVLLFILIFAAGCKKDDDKEKELTKTAILTAKPWKLDKFLIFGQPVTDPEILEAVGSLANSDVQFKADGTYTATNRSTGAKTNGNWEFNADQTKLTIKGGATSEDITFNIVTLTDKNLDLSTQQTVDGFPFPVTVDIKLIPV
jgi:hypothetical protein